MRGSAAVVNAEPGLGRRMDGQVARTWVMASRSAEATHTPYCPPYCHDDRSHDHSGGESPEEMPRYPEHVRPESVVILATPQWFL